MHYITDVRYEADYRLILTFEDGGTRRVDLASHLDGEVFEPLTDLGLFRTAHLNPDIDTVVWNNGADMSPDFLYEISVPAEDEPARKVAEERCPYGSKTSGGASAE